MSNSAVIRRAMLSDADQISELTQIIQAAHATAMPDIFKPADEHTFAPRVVRELLAQPETILIVAEDAGRLVGHVYAEVQHIPESPIKFGTRRLLIHQVVVADLSQRQGIGGRLMAALRQFAQEERIPTMVLDVWRFNTVAHDFYLRNGFRDMRCVMHAHFVV